MQTYFLYTEMSGFLDTSGIKVSLIKLKKYIVKTVLTFYFVYNYYSIIKYK